MGEITEWHALGVAANWGYLTIKEVFAMYTLSAMLPTKGMVINIGVGSGTSSLCFREAGENLEIISVDISEGGPYGGFENERNCFTSAGRGHQLPKQVLGDSKEVGRIWNRGVPDCIFIDGDHTMPGIMGDIQAWWPHLKVGGYMAFHDYGSNFWPDVAVAVEGHIRETGARRIFKVDNLMVIQKVYETIASPGLL